MTKTLLIMALAVLILYYCYQKENKPALNESWIWGTKEQNLPSKDYQQELDQVKQANQTLTSFLRSQLNSNNLEELKTKLNGKSLNEILEENSDWETEVDTLTRTKNSLEQDLLAQSNAFQSRIKEKDRELKRVKEELTNSRSNLGKLREDLVSEKQQHKGSLTRINKLTQQITNLEQTQNNYQKLTTKINSLSISSITKQDLEQLKDLVKKNE